MKNCRVIDCQEQVLFDNEYCYFHRKLKAGLFGPPHAYTITHKDEYLEEATSDPRNFYEIKRGGWDIEQR